MAAITTRATAWRIIGGEYPVAEISTTKEYCAQVQHRLIDACLQVFGGAGYLEETPGRPGDCDGRSNRIGGGADEIMTGSSPSASPFPARGARRRPAMPQGFPVKVVWFVPIQ